MKTSFFKYHGTGNDFILLEDWDNTLQLPEKLIVKLCDRRFGIGADGLIIMSSMPGVDFKMTYYNSDGRESSMCGNGGRCITAFAKLKARIKHEATFSAIDGIHRAIITSQSPLVVKLQMNDVQIIEKYDDLVYIDTGSPHVVKFVDNVETCDVVGEGKSIRYSHRFGAKGVNVNFVQQSGNTLLVRTYERGVEAETLSCGTGVIASAIASNAKMKIQKKELETGIQTKGGKLKVYFESTGSVFKNIWLEGEATFVYKGEIEI